MPADPQFDKVHEKAKPSSPFYGCHNKPRPVPGQTLTSSYDSETWPLAFKTKCMYDRSESDSRCKGCIHKTLDFGNKQ